MRFLGEDNSWKKRRILKKIVFKLDSGRKYQEEYYAFL
jgi:hypothetical protein